MTIRRFEEYERDLHMPTPSGVGCAILRSASGSDLDLERLVAALRSDPASTARVLEACKRHRPSTQATTVAMAASILHPRHLYETAVSFHSRGPRRGAARAFDHDRYWRWSLACACAAELLAERAGLPAEQVRTVALLSRIGMLALATAEPDEFDTLLRDHAGRPVAELLLAEARAWDLDHYELAASMLAGWGFAPDDVLAVRDLGLPARDRPALSPAAHQLADLLRLAEIVASDIVDAAPRPGELTGGRNLPFRSSGAVPEADDEELRWRTMQRLRELTRAFEPKLGPRLLVPDAVAALEPESTQGLRVLAVDDDAVDLRILTAHLEREGCTVLVARSGTEALEILSREAVQVVITDWSMPDMTGSELCRRVRSLDSGRTMFVVVLTGLDDERRAVDVFEAGADEYVTKPFNPRVLLARVKSGLRLARAHKGGDARRLAHMAAERRADIREREMAHLATTDMLTELPNRRRAWEFLHKQWDHAVRSGTPLSVALLDLDHFKHINDVHGHEAGDEVLRMAARVLRKHSRRGDLLCRFGGEEFLLVCPGADLQAATKAAERLRSKIADEPIVRAGYQGRLTVSIGVAVRGPGMLGMDGLLKAADEALYAAKQAGRNRVVTSKAS